MAKRRWAKRHNILTQHGKLLERQRRDDISPVANDNFASGGGGSLVWFSLADICNYGAGITPSSDPQTVPRYALDGDFFYLAGTIAIDSAVAVNTAGVIWKVGDIRHDPNVVHSRPGPDENMASWSWPVACTGWNGRQLALGSLTMPWEGMPSSAGGYDGTLDVIIDSDAVAPSGTGTLFLDGTALPWQG